VPVVKLVQPTFFNQEIFPKPQRNLPRKTFCGEGKVRIEIEAEEG